MADFAAAVRERRPPMATLDRVLTLQQATDAVYASAAAGRALETE